MLEIWPGKTDTGRHPGRRSYLHRGWQQAAPAPNQIPREKKPGWGEQSEKAALGFVAWRICLFGVLSNNFASLVAMAAQSGLHAASLGAGGAEHCLELVQRWSGTAGAQTARPGQLRTCSEPQSRARSQPGALARGSDLGANRATQCPLPKSSLATTSRRTQPPVRCSAALQNPFQLCSQAQRF